MARQVHIDLELWTSDDLQRSLSIRSEGRMLFQLTAPANSPVWSTDDQMAATLGEAVLIVVKATPTR